MYKLLIAILIILVAFFQNPIISLGLGLLLGIILKDNFKEFISNIGSIPLQVGIVLLGFSISFNKFSDLFMNYFPIISIFVVMTFLLGLFLGKLLNLDKEFVYLISSATAICGASAALAISTIINAKPNQISLAVFIIFLMNTIAIVLFPIVGKFLEFTDIQFGLFSALAIHDTASVVGSGLLFSDNAGEISATLKISRTLWILPLIIMFTFITKAKKSVYFNDLPIFIIFFFFAITISNIIFLPFQFYDITKYLSISFINIGIFFIALQSKIEKELNTGILIYPIFLWLIVVLISFITVASL
tara:strand:- start:1822 stop:2730 length:909 start_codon:yes stop_codon:yes gene_type:complete